MAFDSTEVSWRDMTIALNGVKLGKVRQFKENVTRETEHLYGAGDEPFDINPGNKAYGGTMSLYQSVINLMNEAAMTAGFDDLTDLAWTVTVVYKATAVAPMRTIIYPNIQFGSFSIGGANNDKSFVSDIEFKCLKPIRN